LLTVLLGDGWAEDGAVALATAVGADDDVTATGAGGGAAVVGGGATGTTVVGAGAGTEETCELWETCEACELCPLTPDTWDEWLTWEPTPAGASPLTANSGNATTFGSSRLPCARVAPRAGDALTATAATAAASGIIGDLRTARNASKTHTDRYPHARESRPIYVNSDLIFADYSTIAGPSRQ
jgi:hypothetical protein